VDDSIVRGNTMKRLVAALRHQGVKEIHLRSSSPPLRHPCYFGIDIPQEEELIAAGRTVEEVAAYIGVDSLGYLSIAGLGRAVGSARKGNVIEENAAKALLHAEFCYGCMEKSGWPFDPLASKRDTQGQQSLRKALGIPDFSVSHLGAGRALQRPW
jgi:amidophosphoribosyltransferase